MKRIYLPAMESVNFEDIGTFLSWLGSQPSGRISLAKLQRTAQVQPLKLGLLLRLLEQFAFVVKEPEAVSICATGLKFSRAEKEARESMIKNQLLTAWPTRDLLGRLDESGTGRLAKREVLDVLRSGATMDVTEKMTVGIMAWGHSCKLFHFDGVAQEISRIVFRNPLPVGGNTASHLRGA